MVIGDSPNTPPSAAFNRAWLLLKTQPVGLSFTEEEKSFILGTIIKMMNSNDTGLQEDGENLFVQYNRI
jgi:hypothetical protein